MPPCLCISLTRKHGIVFSLSFSQNKNSFSFYPRRMIEEYEAYSFWLLLSYYVRFGEKRSEASHSCFDLLTAETDIMMSVWSLNDREIPETSSNTSK
jgi:hypothetical protein